MPLGSVTMIDKYTFPTIPCLTQSPLLPPLNTDFRQYGVFVRIYNVMEVTSREANWTICEDCHPLLDEIGNRKREPK
jgi:hypothetical protein